MGVEGASFATTLSRFVTFFILVWFYASGRTVIKIKEKQFRPDWDLIKTVTMIGIPTAVIQICLSVEASLTNIAGYPISGVWSVYMMTITYQTIGAARYGLFL